VQHRLFAVAQIGGKYPGRRLSMQLSEAPYYADRIHALRPLNPTKGAASRDARQQLQIVDDRRRHLFDLLLRHFLDRRADLAFFGRRPVRRDDEALELNDLIVIVDAARNLGLRIPPIASATAPEHTPCSDMGEQEQAGLLTSGSLLFFRLPSRITRPVAR
jgi:hypothetical protein